MDVTDVLRARTHEPAGLTRMAAVSLAVHAAIVAFLVFGPGHWLSDVVETPKPIMTITIGGAGEGPKSGGLTAIGGRPVQTTEPAPKPEAVRPPAAKVPEMVVARETAKAVKAAPAPAPAKSIPEARGRTPTRGDEERPGTAVAETSARGQGFGLSTGGGAGSGSRLDVADFCCPDYLVLMTDKIRGNWNQQAEVSGHRRRPFHHPTRRPFDGRHGRSVERILGSRSSRAARRHGHAAAHSTAFTVHQSDAHRVP